MTLLHVCVFLVKKINVPSTGVVCLTFCHLDSSSFLTLWLVLPHLAPSFPPFQQLSAPKPRYVDINELCWSCGVQKKQSSLAVNLLYGHFLSLAALFRCCGWRILKQAIQQRLQEISFPFNSPLSLPSLTQQLRGLPPPSCGT